MRLAVQAMASEVQEVPSTATFSHWVHTACAHLPSTMEQPETLTIRIVDSEEIARLNTTYRNRPGPTNVLAFPPEDIALCGSLVISEATEQHKAVQAHWAHLTVHALLHLCGYDHDVPDAAAVMEQQETEILLALGFSNPYTD